MNATLTTRPKNGAMIIRVSTSLRAEFKALCARRRKSMQQAFIEFMEREVKRSRPQA
jgi:hypothetical protein